MEFFAKVRDCIKGMCVYLGLGFLIITNEHVMNVATAIGTAGLALLRMAWSPFVTWFIMDRREAHIGYHLLQRRNETSVHWRHREYMEIGFTSGCWYMIELMVQLIVLVFFALWAYNNGKVKISLKNFWKEQSPKTKLANLDVQSAPVANILLESAIPGSTELALPMHRSQVVIFRYETDDQGKTLMCLLGNGIRFSSNRLVFPAHLGCDTYDVVYLQSRKGGEPFPLKLGLKGEYQTTTFTNDLQFVDLPATVWAGLGVKVATIGVVSALGDNVTVVGSKGKGTTGVLSNGYRMGDVMYDATTVYGYSGAPYHSGPMILGIHTHGGKRNGGVAATYVRARLAIYEALELGIVEESSEDFMRNVFSGSRRDPRSEDFGDFLIIEYEGNHHTVSRKLYERIKAQKYHPSHLRHRTGFSSDESEYDSEPDVEGPRQLECALNGVVESIPVPTIPGYNDESCIASMRTSSSKSASTPQTNEKQKSGHKKSGDSKRAAERPQTSRKSEKKTPRSVGSESRKSNPSPPKQVKRDITTRFLELTPVHRSRLLTSLAQSLTKP